MKIPPGPHHLTLSFDPARVEQRRRGASGAVLERLMLGEDVAAEELAGSGVDELLCLDENGVPVWHYVFEGATARLVSE